MCGIVAVARVGGGLLDSGARECAERMTDVVAHRGPDDRAVLVDGRVGLGFTRLSLVDPSASGDQPLSTDDGSLVLIVNGEIYNSRELASRLPANSRPRGGSDCEVLLYLYREHGIDFLDQVRGMFALILWDRARGELILARDRFGIKPLFYHRNSTRIVAGSEIKALFADPATPRRFDWEQAVCSPMMPAAPDIVDVPPTTWFAEIEAVPAATVLRVDLHTGAIRPHRYWTFPGEAWPARSTADYIDAYRELLTESITECATADAELGLFLSGGIDSAAVAAIAADTATDLHTFTVLNAGTYCSGDVEHAHRFSAKLGLPNHQVITDPERVPTPQEWKRLVWLLEMPLCGPEIYYKHELHRYAKAVRPDLRGMLLGAASDEFNGGYSNGVLTDGGGWPDFEHNLASMARGAALRDRPALTPWWTYGDLPLFTDEMIREFAGRDLGDPYRNYLRWEYYKIQQYNVWHEDRTAAGSGIEARVPFLDHRLVELVASIPRAQRPELLWDKTILRKAMQGTLPDETVHRPKGPFFYGNGLRHVYRIFLRMLSGDGGSLVEEALAAPGADQLIDGDALRETIARLTEVQSNSPQVEIVLRVVNLGLLAGMTAAPPAPIAGTPCGPLPERVTIGDWLAQREEIESLIGLRTTLEPRSIPSLAKNVLLLRDGKDAGAWYLAVDGELAYEFDKSDPEVLRLLQAIDGTRSLADILAELDYDLDAVRDSLLDLRNKNLVELG
jgi:asparagine synthase (glutamine-hydrolysing)